MRWQFNKRDIFSRSLYVCEYPDCFRRATDLAHRVGKSNIEFVRRVISESFGTDVSANEAKDILNSRMNMAASCRFHNDYFMLSPIQEEARRLVCEIYTKRRKDNGKQEV